MKTRRQRRRYLNLVLILIIALLFAIVAITTYFIYQRNKASLAEFEQSRRNIMADSNVRADIDLESLDNAPKIKIQQSVARPLFMSTRLPYVAPPPPPDKPKPKPVAAKPKPKPEEKPTPLLSETLSGIISEGEDRVALMNSPSGGLRLKEGMIYKGWQVIKIHADHIELSDGKQTDTKYLRSFAQQKAGQSPIIFE